jgi:hypothetical protein
MRIPTNVPVEETQGQVKQLLREFKARDIVLAEATDHRIRLTFAMGNSKYEMVLITPNDKSVAMTYRALFWYLKRTLEVAEHFADGLAEPFLAHKVMESGKNVVSELRTRQGSVSNMRALSTGERGVATSTG